MKHAFHWKRAALLAAALAVAGQARAMSGVGGPGGQSGPSGNGTGGPQIVHQDGGSGGSAEAPSVSPRGSDGVPTWYSVNGITRTQQTQGPTPVVERSRPVPRWYAVS